mgnify:CR=1 FL=1
MQEGQNRKTSSLSILAIAGVEPYQEKPGEEYMNEASWRTSVVFWKHGVINSGMKSIAPLHICRMKQPTSRTR